MPADGPAVSDDSHISFAKRLAHNNKDTRQAALKKVKRWLVTKSKQGTLDHDEIIKIWKGLHYSMWYSDKPVTQQSLALDISQIVSLLPDIDDAINFFGGFCETIAREWVGIDRHRLDKFYMFIKTALKSVMEFCAEKSWDDEIVTNVVDTLDIRIINSQCPDSISVFISEHLFSIYSEVCNDVTPPLFITEMLKCYVTVLSKTPKKDLIRVLMANLLTPIISNSVSFKIDHSQLIDFITTISVQPDILTRNRKLLYKLRNDIAVAGGVDLTVSSPLGKHELVSEEVVNDENLSSNTQDGAVNGEVAKPPKKKKKKKVKQPVEKMESIADTTNETSDNKTEEVSVSELTTDKDDICMTEDQVEEEASPANEAEPVTVDQSSAKVKENGVEVEDEATVEESNVIQPDLVVDPDTEMEETAPGLIEEAQASVVSNEDVQDNKEEVNDTVAEEIDNKTTEDVPETVDEDVTKEDSIDTEVKDTSTDHKEESVEQAADLSEESPIAPTDMEVTKEIESLLLGNLKGSDPEVTYSTPAKKTKRKSTRTKKTPKKKAEESSLTIESAEATENVENTEQSVENGQEATMPSVETTEVLPSPKHSRSVRSLRKRKKKSLSKTPTEDVEIEISEQPAVENGQEAAVPSVVTTEVLPSPKQTRSLHKKKKKSICFTPIADSPSTPETAVSSTKKKVRLSMENNQTFFFKKNTSLESPKPFDSSRTPLKGVLKMSPALTRSQVKKKGKSRIKS